MAPGAPATAAGLARRRQPLKEHKPERDIVTGLRTTKFRRAVRTATRMRTSLKPSSARGDTAHRLYQDEEGADTVFCQQIDHESDLVRLLAGVERIELRQAPGAGWIPAAVTASLIEALQAVARTAESPDPRAERVHREMWRRVADALARIRIRCSRTLLAGITQASVGERDQHVLVLVFVRRGIRSCEWRLAA